MLWSIVVSSVSGPDSSRRLHSWLGEPQILFWFYILKVMKTITLALSVLSLTSMSHTHTLRFWKFKQFVQTSVKNNVQNHKTLTKCELKKFELLFHWSQNPDKPLLFTWLYSPIQLHMWNCTKKWYVFLFKLRYSCLATLSDSTVLNADITIKQVCTWFPKI